MSRQVAPLLALLVVASCGGGGGGSSGGGDGGSASDSPAVVPPVVLTLPPATGAAPPDLALDATNAAQAAATATRAMEQAGVAAEAAGMSLSAVGPRTAGAMCVGSAMPPTFSLVDADKSGGLSVGDQAFARYFTCGRKSDGTVLVTLTAFDSAASHFEGNVEFSATDPHSATIEGTFKFTVTYQTDWKNHDIVVSDASIAVAEAGTIDRVKGGAMRYTLGPQSVYRVEMSGRVDNESLDGSYAFATSVPLASGFNSVPSLGALDLSAANSNVRILPSADPDLSDDHADIATDPTGSGQYAVAGNHVPWAHLSTGFLFQYYSGINTRPLIQSLTIDPPNPTALDTLVAHYGVLDEDGDKLNTVLDWWLNGKRITTINLGDPLPASMLHKGDHVEARLQVDDFHFKGVRLANAAVTIANAVPRDVTITPSPSPPRSVDDFSVSWTASDPDGDPLQATFAWRNDGAPIAGQTDSVLPHSMYKKGDRVTAVVNVSDGAAVTTSELTLTIADSPANVAVPSPPAGVDYGNTVTFDAIATDPDGDSTAAWHFVLEHGPAGMTVNPTTGTVSWVASGPMFTQEVGVSWGVTIDEPGAGTATGTFTVTDANRELPFMRSGLDGQTVLGGLQTGDFDGDGDEETLVLTDTRAYELERDGTGGYRDAWTYLFAFGGYDRVTAVTHADVDGDGRHEIFLASGNEIVQLDGVKRRVARRAKLPLTGNLMCQELKIADLNLDGSPELVCLASDFAGSSSSDELAVLLVLDARTLSVIKQYPTALYGPAMAIGNVDNDAALEIVTSGGQIFDGNAVFGPSSTPERFYAPGFGFDLAIGDVTGDGVEEIVASSITGAGVRAFSGVPATPTILWTIPGPDTLSVNLADVAATSRPEVLVGEGNGARWKASVKAYDASTAMPTVPPTLLFSMSSDNYDGVSAVAVGDLDNDGAPEVIWGDRIGELAVQSAASPPALEWQIDPAHPADRLYGFAGGELLRHPSHPTAVLFAAPSGSGQLRLVAMDAATGGLAASAGLGDAGPRFRVGLAVADYDDNGTDDVFLAGYRYALGADGAFYTAYDFWGANAPWLSATFVGETGPAGVARGDLDGDGHDEVVVITSLGVLRVYNPVTGSLLWQSPSPTEPCDGSDVAIANLDGVGKPEIVAAGCGAVVVYSWSGAWSYTRSASLSAADVIDLEVADTNGDGGPEIFVMQRGTVGPTTVQRLDGALHSLGSLSFQGSMVGMTIERSAFARKNLVLTETLSPRSSRLRVVDPRSGAAVWSSPPLLGTVRKDGVHFHDVVGNGELRISVATDIGVLLTR